MKLDLTDRKILYNLDKNARQGIAALAKKLRIGKNVALYRINRMKKGGVIKGSFTEINNAALGYHSFRIFFKLGNTSTKSKEELYDFICENPNTLWFSRVLGKWDLDIMYMTKEIPEFEKFRREIFMKYNKLIEDSEISLLTRVYHYTRDYLINQDRKIISPTLFDISISPTYKPDKVDEDLLKTLSQDATINIIDISNKLGISINTVKKRMKNLEDHKIILSYRLFIDSEKTGHEYFKLHISLRHYTEGDLNQIRQWLSQKNFVLYTDHHINGEDFEIELLLESESKYLEFVDELNSEFGKIIKDHFLLKFFDNRIYRYLPAK